MSQSILRQDQKNISSLEKEYLQDQSAISLEEKYQKLLKAYQDVCLERDMLRKAIQMYALYQ